MHADESKMKQRRSARKRQHSPSLDSNGGGSVAGMPKGMCSGSASKGRTDVSLLVKIFHRENGIPFHMFYIPQYHVMSSLQFALIHLPDSRKWGF